MVDSVLEVVESDELKKAVAQELETKVPEKSVAELCKEEE